MGHGLYPENKSGYFVHLVNAINDLIEILDNQSSPIRNVGEAVESGCDI